MSVSRASCMYLLSLVPLLVFLLNSCSVFSAAGSAISSGYENTVSYFNAYYNAERLFAQAEDEILEAEKAARITRSLQSAPLPASAKQKLAVVNDKCSNILSFHPTSALVDDALLLIGKSFFYQGEHRKAERKFTELITQFPASPLGPEAGVWLVRTVIKLGRNQEALTAAQTLAQDLMNRGEDELAADAFVLVGDLQVLLGNPTGALESYQKVEEFDPNEDVLAGALMKRGKALVSMKEFGRAASAFLTASELASDATMEFEAKLEAVRSFRAAGSYEKAVELSDDLLSDFRFSSWSKEIRFERGLTFGARGDLEKSKADFWAIDTTSTRSEIGVKAAYELGRILEHQDFDYRGARGAYSRALSFPVPSITPDARRRQSALVRYFALTGQIVVVDSLADVEVSKPQAGKADSLQPGPDSRKIDSLKARKGVLAYDLAEVFYSELDKPDSALFWYRQALATKLDSTRTPRILFVLAEIARNSSRNNEDYRDLYQRILREYPNSPFAFEAKIQLGMKVSRQTSNPAESLYTIAEGFLEKEQPAEAVAAMERIIREHPWSPYAAKSRYAIGWIYEYHLQQPDSALVHYKTVLDQYGNSPYAMAIRPRLAGESAPDTMQLKNPALNEKGIDLEKEEVRPKGKPPSSKEIIKE